MGLVLGANRGTHKEGGVRNAHIRYDINDGLVDVVLEVIPTEEQKAVNIKLSTLSCHH